MDERQRDLSNYRIQEANDSLKVAIHCLNESLYRDAINRSYYADFYIASKEKAFEQYEAARQVIDEVKKYLKLE